MGHTIQRVPSHDVAALIDRVARSSGSVGKIKAAELAAAQQKAMGYTGGVPVPAGNVAALVDAIRAGERRAWKIKSGGIAIAQEQAMRYAVLCEIRHDIAGAGYPVGLGSAGAREVDCGVSASAQQKAVRALV